ncbi:hypothetical protein PR001_g8203 [Phytophthora rubi]|uniref:Uncharacterized protein n=1 Tax=Phytophthora rubi TaxID=129364 RepID=A0A6A3NA03_9STRA|nr:hypothetical protein PR001_g8203 [Phytophthora rubi]
MLYLDRGGGTPSGADVKSLRDYTCELRGFTHRATSTSPTSVPIYSPHKLDAEIVVLSQHY